MALVWTLIIAGVILLLLAEPLAKAAATTATTNMSYVDAEAAKMWTLKFYLLGGMSFIAGLVERIAIEIAGLRVSHPD